MTDIRARWTGESFLPVGGGATRWCKETLRLGEVVTLPVQRDRNPDSHRHFFATVNEAWSNLPECMVEAPYAKSADVLRKHALIVTGFASTTVLDCGSPAVAHRIAAQMKDDGERADGYCIVQINGQIVTRAVARSQSQRAMGRDEFERSKRAVLEWLGKLLEVHPQDLQRGAA